MNEIEDKKQDVLLEVPPVETIGELLVSETPSDTLLTEVPLEKTELLPEEPVVIEGEVLTEEAAPTFTEGAPEPIVEEGAPVKKKRIRKRYPKKTEEKPVIKKAEEYTSFERKALLANYSRRTLKARFGIDF